MLAPADRATEELSAAALSSDLVANSYTGSGKTLAFLLPLFAELSLTDTHRPCGETPVSSVAQPLGLILAPTRELCQQISTVAGAIATSSIVGENGSTERISVQLIVIRAAAHRMGQYGTFGAL